MIPFPLKMAWRETRGQWRRFMFVFACIAIGVGSVVSVGLFSTNVGQVIFHDARALLGGDLEIRLSRPLSEAGTSILDSFRRRGVTISHIRELVGMASSLPHTDPSASRPIMTQLVELKSVDSAYPLYGSLRTDPPQPLQTLLALPSTACPTPPCHGVLVQESLLIRLGLSIGSPIKIGHAQFIISGILLKEPDRVAGAFSLGPRVILSSQALAATDLVKQGSRIRERYRLRLPERLSLPAVKGELQGRLAKEGARITSYREAQPRIRRFLDNLSTYLGLIGLTALFVGGIGVACTIQGFMEQKVTNIAIMKAIGADSGTIINTYLSQSVFLGGVGSLLGAGLGILFQLFLPVLLSGLIPVAITTSIFPGPILKGIMLGMGSTLLFALWPILMIRHVPPALVFRRQVDLSSTSSPSLSRLRRARQHVITFFHDHARWGTALAMGVGLGGLAMWQAQSISLGMIFLAAFLAGLILILTSVNILLWCLPTAKPVLPFILRQAITNIRRPGNYTAGMAVSIGIGVMVLMTIASVKISLLNTIGKQIPDKAPSFFFIDIQPDQKAVFETLLQEWAPEGTVRLTPVVRSRLAAINGKRIDPEEHKGKRNGWYFTREYVLTSLAQLPENNEVVKGDWWPPDRQTPDGSTPVRGTPFVSVEQEAAKHLGVDIGDVLEFDIQGTILPAKISSTRKVDWGSFSTNFFMIFSPGAFDEAPLTYIATAKVTEEQEIPLQRAMVSALPNVTAIKIGDVLENIANLLRQLAWAIQGLATLCLLSGIIVMIAALSVNRYRRLYESSILKALGETRGEILQSFALEFGIIGALAGVVGLFLGGVLSWVLVTFFLDLSWTFDLFLFGNALSVTILLALAVGLLSTYRILAQPPLAVLRQE